VTFSAGASALYACCDYRGCDAVFDVGTINESDARSCLSEHGWSVVEGATTKTYCVKHRERDMVNNPPHYTFGKFEVIDVVEDWQLDFNLGNAIKYIARHRHKGKPLEDLKKAKWYLERAIKNLEKP
jgi:uncharacterized protein DUF3310